MASGEKKIDVSLNLFQCKNKTQAFGTMQKRGREEEEEKG